MATKTAKQKPLPRPGEAPEPKGGVAKAGLAAQEAGCPHSVSGKAKANAVSAAIPFSAIEVTKGFNPRTSMPSEEIDALADNIRRNGLLQPVLLRPKAGEPGRYLLVAGERRYTAIKRLGWDNIPATIRLDLEGDDAKAKAVAVAENSEDLDRPLNYIELGRAFQEFQKEHGWDVSRIAAETGVNSRKVRRALDLMSAPEDIQKHVASGDMSMLAGVELAKMDPDVRKKIRAQIQANTSAEEVKRLAKQMARAEGAKPKPGQKANRAKGATKAAAKYTWRPTRQKQGVIAEIAFKIAVEASKDDEGTEPWCELRGALAYALWERGDLEEPILPDRKTKDKRERKVLDEFSALAKAEAKKHTPAEPEAADGAGAGAAGAEGAEGEGDE